MRVRRVPHLRATSFPRRRDGIRQRLRANQRLAARLRRIRVAVRADGDTRVSASRSRSSPVRDSLRRLRICLRAFLPRSSLNRVKASRADRLRASAAASARRDTHGEVVSKYRPPRAASSAWCRRVLWWRRGQAFRHFHLRSAHRTPGFARLATCRALHQSPQRFRP